MNKKIINYTQITIGSLIVTALVVMLCNLIGTHANAAEITIAILKMEAVVCVTMIGIIALREVKFLKPNEKEKDYFLSVEIRYAAVTLFSLVGIYFFKFGTLGQSNRAMVGILIISFIAGIIQTRYSIAMALLIAGILMIFSIETYYFTILGCLLLVTLISLIFKLIFFTKWSDFIKEKNLQT